MSTGAINANGITGYGNDHQPSESQDLTQRFYQYTHSPISGDVRKLTDKMEVLLSYWHIFIFQHSGPFAENYNSLHVGGKTHHHHYHTVIQNHASKVADDEQKKQLQHRLEELVAELEAEELKAEEYHLLANADKAETLKAQAISLENKLNEQGDDNEVNPDSLPSQLKNTFYAAQAQTKRIQELLKEMNQNIKNSIS